MSEHIVVTATSEASGSGGGRVGEGGRVLPRLFGERVEETEGTAVGVATGGVGGSEGEAVREEVCDLLTPTEAPEPDAPNRGWTQPPEVAAEEAKDQETGSGYGDARDEESGSALGEEAVSAPDVSESDDESDEHTYDEDYVSPALAARRKGSPARKLRAIEVKLGPAPGKITAGQRLLILDTWQRSGLTAGAYAEILGLSPHTLYAWKKRFAELGPAGLDEKPRGTVSGSRLPEVTRRAIVMMKKQHPDWGSERIHDMLMRSAGFTASAGAIVRVLREAGYESVPVPTHPHPPVVRRFERARVNELWQTDLFTFLLKREPRRVYLVGFMDDHSRYMVGYGLYASSSGAVVREVFEEAIANYGAPVEVLTDNGTQYHTWRGKSRFRELCERRGIKQIVARPRHPQTLGKIERFWGSLWRDLVQAAIFEDLKDARRRIGLYMDYYNFHRPHQGLDGLVPADRFFESAPQVRETLRARVASNALDLAQHGYPRQSFYLTGRVGDEGISLHGESGKVVLTKSDGTREEVDLLASGRRAQPSSSSAASPVESAEARQTIPPENPRETAAPTGPPLTALPDDTEPAPGGGR
jgi:transposase InsO family protein